MSDELFPPESVAMDSPKLAWGKRIGLRTWHSIPDDPQASCWFAGLDEWAKDFSAKNQEHFRLYPNSLFLFEAENYDDQRMGVGPTEDEAIYDLAHKNCIPLWNEETP
jgi:hypothetical protein